MALKLFDRNQFDSYVCLNSENEYTDLFHSN